MSALVDVRLTFEDGVGIGLRTGGGHRQAERERVRLHGPKIVAVPGELSAGEYRYLPHRLGAFLLHRGGQAYAGGGINVKVRIALLVLDFVWQRVEADGLLDIGH